MTDTNGICCGVCGWPVDAECGCEPTDAPPPEEQGLADGIQKTGYGYHINVAPDSTAALLAEADEFRASRHMQYARELVMRLAAALRESEGKLEAAEQHVKILQEQRAAAEAERERLERATRSLGELAHEQAIRLALFVPLAVRAKRTFTDRSIATIIATTNIMDDLAALAPTDGGKDAG